MNSLRQLEQTLSARRKRREHLTSHASAQRLDLTEVRNTNLEVGLYSGSPPPSDISKHLKDIEYTKKWHTIYQTMKGSKPTVPANMILALKNFGENRVEELEEKLEAIDKFENHEDESTRDTYRPKIDLFRWKIKYYQQTLLDGQEMLNKHGYEALSKDDL
ncbi:uncharacterized protein DFL_001348 [Arthrobotrys flagrans]|uniref:Uncharacterized protein n=1 Tax=Arthrobotrys flagrans TaxID=97331 RepID=A0A437AGV7_ARTFL|nr:hypothetical protein DFL_001348 [Arthrobotrys flagrans]